MKAAAIVVLMCLLVPPGKHRTEDEDQARARYATVATAIAAEAKTRAEALYLLTVYRHESAFHRDVHRGLERGDDAKSWCLGQILLGQHAWTKVPGTDYRARDLVGLELGATRRCTEVALTKLRRGIASCGANRPTCVLRSYGGVTSKNHPGITARAKTFQRLQRRAP